MSLTRMPGALGRTWECRGGRELTTTRAAAAAASQPLGEAKLRAWLGDTLATAICRCWAPRDRAPCRAVRSSMLLLTSLGGCVDGGGV